MIFYSHINEDNRVERALLQEGGFSTAVAICGSGERVLSLMDSEACKKIVVVDCNREAIFLVQLKLAALTQLCVNEYLGFIGHSAMPKEERIACFNLLKKHLPPEAHDFWQNNPLLLKKGVLHIGHFERFLQRARPVINVWLGKSFQTIFQPGDTRSRFPATRWKLLQHLFRYKLVYQLFGNRDTAFTGSHANLERIPAALDETIRNGRAASSFMAHLIFKGHLLEMNEKELPPSLQKKVLAVIKERLLNGSITIEYHVEDLLLFLQQQEEISSPVFYSLSDILSFASVDYLHAIIKKAAVNENCIVGRSFLQNRLTPEQLSLFNGYAKTTLHDSEESTGMYQVFSLQTQIERCPLH